MLEWIKTWTFFNWLTLVAFIFGCISVSNAFLSLRSRYKDWRGVQSKKAYEKRLLELNNLVQRIGSYRRKPATYFFEVVYNLLYILTFYLIGISMFAAVFSGLVRSAQGSLFTTIFSLGGLLILGFITGQLSVILRLAKCTAYPHLLKKEVIDFMKSGSKKKLLSEEKAGDILATLYGNDLVTEDEVEKLINLGTKSNTTT